MGDDATHHALREAIHSQQVVERANGADPGSELGHALATCGAIGQRMAEETEQVVGTLEAHGIRVTGARGDEHRQRHTTQVDVGSRDDARRAADVLVAGGWQHLHDWSGGAARSFWANCSRVPLLRTADSTLALDLCFEPDHRTGARADLLRPAPPDWYAIALPRPWWWAYRLVRPLRIVGSRVGVPIPTVPAPFLSTPDALIDPLLDVAGVSARDVVMDLGCGDGRLVVTAAERRGCRGVGVETQASRVELARRRAAASPAADRIEIRAGDAFDTPLDEATVLLMFLPLDAVADALPTLLDQLRPGARVVVHEQSPLPERIHPPERSLPVVTPEALTVAHVWRVG